MKNLFLIAIVFGFYGCVSAPLTKEASSREFIIDSKGTGSENYSKIKLFVSKSFKSAQKVIQMDDSSSQTMVVKGIVNCSDIRASAINEPADIGFTLTISSKSNRVRFLFEDLNASYTTAQYGTSNRNDLISSPESQSHLTSCLKAYFPDSFSSVEKKDNW